MPETPNHSYNIPEEGATDWHQPLNENFRQYDTDIEIRDEEANRSNYEPVDGAKFLATDTGVVSIGDGENWLPALALARYRAPAQSNTPGIAFGYQNSLNGEASTISGGGENRAAGGATVAGGSFNGADGRSSAIGGGSRNEAGGFGDVVCGGANNTTDGGSPQQGASSIQEIENGFATVPGGKSNTASGRFSFAAGRQADASEDGSFVWGDGTRRTVQATQANQMVFQAGGGVTIFSASDASAGVRLSAGSGSWSSLSAASAKSNVQTVDPQGVLDGVESLDVSTWEYDAEADATHMGPMAGEFHDAFGLGADADRIANVDADGVALAAIQGLAERVEEKENRIEEQDERIEKQDERIEELATENEALRERLAALERQVDSTDAAGGGERSTAD
ncbi:tail fiber domain-containing protein [Haloglomus salinum]|uniref:tail fiber domain-containing protein n=1 Tax=Haloglomus salinum TaxID=2962673 RepID=UPI0020C94AAC|nr:hypothetical protein [Haloglomus salinum]